MESDALDYLRRLRSTVAATTYVRKAWELRTFLQWMERNGKLISGITRADVEAFLMSLTAGSRYRRVLCTAVRDLFTFLGVSKNPAADITFKRNESRRLPVVPSKTAVYEIIGRLSGADDILRIRDRLMVELAYGSGLRRDELRKINIEDINLEERTIIVNGKGNKTRIVPVTGRAAAVTREYMARRRITRGPLLVSYAGRRLSCGGVYMVLRERAGIRPHLLRHACATHMLAQGAGIRIIQEMLGHADLKSTQFYTAVEKGNLAQVVNEKHPRKNTISLSI